MNTDIQQLRQSLQENLASKVTIAEIATHVTDIQSDLAAINHSLGVLQTAVDSFANQ